MGDGEGRALVLLAAEDEPFDEISERYCATNAYVNQPPRSAFFGFRANINIRNNLDPATRWVLGGPGPKDDVRSKGRHGATESSELSASPTRFTGNRR